MARREDAGVRIGIDLGTTHSLAAVLMDGQAIIIPNALGERLTSSAVSVDNQGRTGSSCETRCIADCDDDGAFCEEPEAVICGPAIPL